MKKRFFQKTIITFLCLFYGVPSLSVDNTYVGETRNLTPVKNIDLMSAVSVEAFLSALIYNRSEREIGKEFYYDYADDDTDKTKYKKATLRVYKNIPESGFTAGIFETTDHKLIIAFGGTTANSTVNNTQKSDLLSTVSAVLIDIVVDLQLLSYNTLPQQVSDTVDFMVVANSYASEHGFDWDTEVHITGHSLGGGLAQYAGLLSNLTTITFNTAPAPITPKSISEMNTYFSRIGNGFCANCGVNDQENQIINIFANNDPLTTILQGIEAVEYGITESGDGSYSCSGLACITEEDVFYVKSYQHLVSLHSQISTDIQNNKIWSRIKEDLPVSELIAEMAVLLLGANLSQAADLNETAFMSALVAFKDGNFQLFTQKMKTAYNISDSFNMTSIITGSRNVINTNTAHGIAAMINNVYNKTDKFNLLPVKFHLPELYQYVDGSYTREGISLPAESNVDSNLSSRLSNYYYEKFYKPLLASEIDMFYSALHNAEVTNEKIEAFANNYLSIGSIATEIAILATDTLTNISDEELNLNTKRKIVASALSSGKSTAVDLLPDTYKELTTTVDNCLGIIKWVPDLSGAAITSVVGQEVAKKADQVLACAVGESVKFTSRFYHFFSVQANLEKWQWHALAKNYLDVYFACGHNNSACLVAQFNGKSELSDQLDFLIDEYSYQGFNFRLRNGAEKYIQEYQQSVVELSNVLLDLVPNEYRASYAYANVHTKNLDFNVDVLSLDSSLNEITLNLHVENLLNKPLHIHDIEIFVVTSGGVVSIPTESNENVKNNFLKTYAPYTNHLPVIVPLALNTTELFSDEVNEARVVVNISYGTQHITEKSIQRVIDINTKALMANEIKAVDRYTEAGGLAETFLEITIPEGEGRNIANPNLKTITVLAGDKVFLRTLVGASSDITTPQNWLDVITGGQASGYVLQSHQVRLLNTETLATISVAAELSANAQLLSFIIPTDGTWTIVSYTGGYENESGQETVIEGSFGAINAVVAGDPSSIPATPDDPEESNDITDGLIAYYPFDGNANDASGNGHHGTEQGGVGYADGKVGQAASFDGVDDYINLVQASTLGLTDSVSICMFLTVDNGGTQQPRVMSVFDSNQERYFDIWTSNPTASRTLGYNSGDASYIGLELTNEETIHLCLVIGAESSSFYNDGVLSNQINTGSIDFQAGSVYLGRNSGESCSEGLYCDLFKGEIDELRIYNRKLTQPEIKTLYQQGSLNTGLIAYYPFDGNANDASGNGYDGVEFGDVTYVDGQVRQAAYLKEPTDFIGVEKDIVLNDFSISFFVNIERKANEFEGPSATNMFLNGGNSQYANEFNFSWFSDNENIEAYLSNVGKKSSSNFNFLNKWTFVTYTSSNNIINLYLNGVIFYTFDLSDADSVVNIEYLVIGKDQDTLRGAYQDNQSLLGMIDELRIYNRALAESEIKTLYEQGSLNTGLVAYYPFDGNANDASGNGHDGVENGGLSYANGKVGQAASFDGVDDYIDVAHSDKLSMEQFTLVLWVKSELPEQSILLKGRYNGIVDENNQREYDLKTTRGTIHDTNQNWVFSSYSNEIKLNYWELLAVSFNGNKFRTYKNGLFDTEVINSNGINQPIAPASLTIGSAFDVENGVLGNQQQAFKGYLDELRIYNRALTEAEIKAVFEQSSLEINPTIIATHPLNDTGITTCSNATGNGLPCPVENFPGQDAQYGRDALAAQGKLQKVGAGHAGFDFTKLDTNGNTLAASASEWSCVKDNVTGLIWEVKTDDGGLQDKDNTYTWYNPNSSTNGGSAGIEGSNNTYKYVNEVNQTRLCGATNWRMPTKEELHSIVNSNTYSPSIDSDYFPNTQANYYWSSSLVVSLNSYAWLVNFSNGNGYYHYKSNDDHVRLVCDGQ